MRTSLTYAALALVSLVSASTSNQDSLSALLDRISSQNNRALPVNAIPDELKSFPPPVVPNKKSPPSQTAPTNPKGGKERMTKRYKQFRDGRRWVWSPSIIQDDTPASGLPPVGSNANLLSSNVAPVNTPAATLSAWTPPAATSSPIAPVSVHPKDRDRVGGVVAAKERHQQMGQKLKKKWIWSDSIIQDGDTVPAGAEHTTPAATLVAPTFPALSPPAEASTSAVPSLSVTSSVPLSAPAEASSVVPPPFDEAAIFSAVAAANHLALLDASVKAAQTQAPPGAIKKVKREKRHREE